MGRRNDFTEYGGREDQTRRHVWRNRRSTGVNEMTKSDASWERAQDSRQTLGMS